MTLRKENWPDLLAEYVDKRRKEPFAWGSNDCCLFAADWVQACTGTDYASAWRGRYTGKLGAARFLDEAGGLGALVDSLGMERVLPSQAGRGDVVMQEAGRGPSLGICLGASTAFVNDNGLIFGAIKKVEKAWRI
jgi:hypothetical protein